LGEALLEKGENGEAMIHIQRALALNPDNPDPHNNLGILLGRQGLINESIESFKKSLAINPDSPGAHWNLGKTLFQRGARKEGIAHLQRANELRPDNMDLANDFAWMLSTAPEEDLRDGKKAVELALQANKDSGGNDPVFLDTLAASYAETGAYPKALETARKALALAEQEENKDLSASLKEEITLYEAGKPCRDPR
jgi:tetratricopeptide (TPR) repeat protein